MVYKKVSKHTERFYQYEINIDKYPRTSRFTTSLELTNLKLR